MKKMKLLKYTLGLRLATLVALTSGNIFALASSVQIQNNTGSSLNGVALWCNSRFQGPAQAVKQKATTIITFSSGQCNNSRVSNVIYINYGTPNEHKIPILNSVFASILNGTLPKITISGTGTTSSPYTATPTCSLGTSWNGTTCKTNCLSSIPGEC